MATATQAGSPAFGIAYLWGVENALHSTKPFLYPPQVPTSNPSLMELWNGQNGTAQAEFWNRPLGKPDLDAIHQSPQRDRAGTCRLYLTSPPLDPGGLHGLSSSSGGYLTVSHVLNPYTGLNLPGALTIMGRRPLGPRG